MILICLVIILVKLVSVMVLVFSYLVICVLSLVFRCCFIWVFIMRWW